MSKGETYTVANGQEEAIGCMEYIEIAKKNSAGTGRRMYLAKDTFVS